MLAASLESVKSEKWRVTMSTVYREQPPPYYFVQEVTIVLDVSCSALENIDNCVNTNLCLGSKRVSKILLTKWPLLSGEGASHK